MDENKENKCNYLKDRKNIWQNAMSLLTKALSTLRTAGDMRNLASSLRGEAAANPLLASGQDPHKSKIPPRRLHAQCAASSSQSGAGEK